MPTRNVVLTDHHQKTIDRLVRSGRYQNASEVLREGLRLVEQREREDATKLKVLREAIQVGLDDLDAGRFVEVGEDELSDYVAELVSGARAKKKK